MGIKLDLGLQGTGYKEARREMERAKWEELKFYRLQNITEPRPEIPDFCKLS